MIKEIGLIDPHAIVDPSARLADDVTVGPFSIVGPDVEIGPGTVIGPHVIVKGPTVIGANNRIFQFASVGEDTPDLKYNGEPTRLIIGDGNTIREGVTIHRGTIQDRGETRIGNNNLLMAYVHVGHDSVVGNNCVLINNASLAGHVTVDDWVTVSGYALIHQFCSIGAHAFVGMGSWIKKDVAAYVTVLGTPAEARGINQEGLRRREFSPDTISAIRKAYKIVFRRGLVVEEALEELSPLLSEHPEIEVFINSIKSSERGIVR